MRLVLRRDEDRERYSVFAFFVEEYLEPLMAVLDAEPAKEMLRSVEEMYVDVASMPMGRAKIFLRVFFRLYNGRRKKRIVLIRRTALPDEAYYEEVIGYVYLR